MEAPKFESMEERVLLSLLGVPIELPVVNYDALGVVAYNATAHTFDSDSTPTSFQLPGMRPIPIQVQRDFLLHILVNNDGTLIGGVSGNDLYIEGNIDVNPGVPGYEYGGVLLTGEIAQFGYQDSGTATDQYDFRFIPTGGALKNDFFTDKDMGVRMTSTNSTFGAPNFFNANFGGGAMGVVGPIPKLAASSLAGRVFKDLNNNGIDESEPGINGVTVTLSGTDYRGTAVNLMLVTSTLNGVDGSYKFTNVLPGTYTLTETQPAGYLDGKDASGTFDGTVGDDVVTNVKVGIGQAGTGYTFGELLPASLAGRVWLDINNNGQIDAGEGGIADVTVTLTGTDDRGGAVSQTATTGADGSYLFPSLRPGTYDLTETQSAGYLDGQDIIGMPGGSTANDKFFDIALAAGVNGANNDFGELPVPAIQIVKSGPVVAHTGEAVTYQYQVSNPSLASLSNLSVLDDKAGAATYVGGDTDSNGLLDPNEVWTLSATYTPDFTAGSALTNTATVAASFAGVAVSDQAAYTLYPLVLQKQLYLYLGSGPADTVAYTQPDNTSFTVELAKDGSVVDTLVLAPSSGQALWVSEGTYTAKEVDLATGYISAYDLLAYTTGQGSATLTFANVVTFDLAVTKTGPASGFEGETVTYSYQVANSGPAVVTPALNDDKAGTPVYVSGDTNSDSLIGAGETWIYQAQYLLPMGSGGTSITNTVTVDNTQNPHAAGVLGGDTNAANDASQWTVSSEMAPSSLAGFVWVDFNDDGLIDFNERAIQGVTITLTGTDYHNAPVSQTTTTDEDGFYQFAGLLPGTYTIKETQPAGFVDGQDAVGTVGGVLGNDVISTIQLESGVDGMNYNFGERPLAGSSVVSGQTATIGFWQNKNGQNLLKSLNGGSTATQLGNWLAATLPNLYASLAGMTNAQIAAYYTNLFKARQGVAGPAKVDCQVMAVAFAVYATNSTLAGTTAQQYGFRVTEYGVSIATWNVGSNGAAFGVANNTTKTVLDLLLATDAMSSDGRLYYLNNFYNVQFRTLANAVYTAINEAGDIG